MNGNQDIEQLRLLAIFHYVVAGMLALFSLFPVAHLVLGIAVLTGALDHVDPGSPSPEVVGWLFVVFAAVFIAGGLTTAALIALVGRCMGHRTNYTYCLVMAGIECVFMPFGTVLGVFTIIVLVRPSVRALFGVTG